MFDIMDNELYETVRFTTQEEYEQIIPKSNMSEEARNFWDHMFDGWEEC